MKFKDSRSNADDISGRLEDMDEPLSYLSRTQDAYTPKLEMEVSSIKTSTEFFILKNKIADIMYNICRCYKSTEKENNC